MRTWLHKLRQAFEPSPRRRQTRSRRPQLESLESRDLLAGSLTGQILPISAVEGTSFTGRIAKFSDSDGNADPGAYTVTIDWGDQTTSTGTVRPNEVEAGFNVTGTHTYADDANYTVRVIIQDVDGASTTLNGGEKVGDAPITPSGVTINAVEGNPFTGAVATFTTSDPNAVPEEFTATIDWGDGNTSAGTISRGNSFLGFTVTGTNTYADVGTYTVTVQIHSNGGSSATANATANVTEAGLTLTGVPVNALEAKPFSAVVARLSDGNPLATTDDFTATIDWGDGRTSAGSFVDRGDGQFDVVGGHTYDNPGTFVIQVVVRDKGGATANANANATVADAALAAQGVPVNVPRGGAVNNALVATFTDSGGAKPVSNYTATINWGDNSPATAGTITVANGTFSVVGSHTYALPGKFVITTTIRSAGGASTTATSDAVYGSLNERFVAKAYQDILQRAADANGLRYFTDLLDRGLASREQVARLMTASLEYRTKVVQGLYRSLLGREADDNGLNYFVNLLGSGGRISDVRAIMVGSLEYFFKNGSNNSSFLAAAYQSLLGRPIDSVGRTFFGQLLSAGVSRTTVALLIATSTEGYTRLVRGFYQTFLRREADTNGLNYFVGLLQRGGRDEDAIAIIVGSEEYFVKL